MLVFNSTKQKVIFTKVNIADSFLKRLRGLIGRKSLDEEEVLVFFNCNWIHTFFMSFPIDVIFLNKNFEVVRIDKNLPPQKFSSFVPQARTALECSAYRVEDKDIEVGDLLEFRE